MIDTVLDARWDRHTPGSWSRMFLSILGVLVAVYILKILKSIALVVTDTLSCTCVTSSDVPEKPQI